MGIFNKFKKMLGKSEGSPVKQAHPAEQESTMKLIRKDLGYGVDLEFTFSHCCQSNLERINQTLSEYTLKDVTVKDHTGAVVTQTTVDPVTGKATQKQVYGLESCILHCLKANPGECLDFQIGTAVYPPVVLHHDKGEKPNERKIILLATPEERNAPGGHVVNWHDSGICGDGLRYREEKGVLYIEGQGTIEERAFDEDDSFWKVVIAPGCTGIGDCAFSDCKWLQEVILPEGLSWIGECAFHRCSSLETINIPNTVVEIKGTAFAECVNLNPLKIPSSVAYIDYDTFDHVPEIHYNGLVYRKNNWGAEKWICSKEIEVEEIALNYYRENCDMSGQCGKNFCYYWSDEDVLYLEGSGALTDDWDVYSMNDEKEARGYLRYLVRSKRIVISDGCTAIGDSVFDLDRDLHDFRSNWALPEIFEAIWIRIPYGVTEIGKRAFAGCSQVISLEIPETVVKIGEDAFLDVPHIIYHGPAQSDNNWGAKSRN